MKKLSLLFVTVLMLVLFAVSASAATKGYYTYEVYNGEATITDVNTSISGDITIPATLGGYSVTTIGYMAFDNCDNLTSVTIPDSVTTIGDFAFAYCDSLTSVTIGDSVTTVGEWAFAYCDSLTSVTIGDSVTTIGDAAFYNCDSLTSVTIPDSVTTIGRGAFEGCDSLTSVTIGDSVTTIVDYAFEWCTNLTSVTIPDSVTTIGEAAFYYCDSLTSVTIPDSVTTIGDGAFAYCDSLTSVTIPDSVTTIGDEAFYNCDSLTSIVVDINNSAYSNDSRGVLFNKNKTILIQYPAGNTGTSYTIPDSVTTIGDYAFYDCDSLTSVTIPDSVTTIGDYAFYECYSLTSVTIPDSVTTIGEAAFYYCDSLTSVTIPDSVTTIGDRAFACCYSLTSVTIPDSVTTIGEGAFYYCDSLTSIVVDADNPAYSSDSRGALFDKNKTILIQYPADNTGTSYTIPDSVTAIGNYAFYGCDSLTSVTIPDSVTTIGEAAFEHCCSLTSVTIPDSVTTIGEAAFEHCYSLTSVTIPDSVTSIGDDAFASCDSLTDVYYKGTEEQWKEMSIGSYNDDLLNATIHYNYCPINTPDTHSYTLVVTKPATHLVEGVRTYTCSACGASYTDTIAKTKDHSYTVSKVIAPTCEKEGYTVYICGCGQSENRDIKAAKGHNYNGFTCADCGETKADNCSCKCHKGGIAGFFWKIGNFFNKLFKIKSKQFCACGIAHY